MIYLNDSYSLQSGEQISIPFNTPIIGYKSIFLPGDVLELISETPTESIFNQAPQVWSPLTGNGSQYTKLLSNGVFDNGYYVHTQVIQIRNSQNKPFDYFGIAGHNMYPTLQTPGDNMHTPVGVGFQVSDDGFNWTTLLNFLDNMSNDTPMFVNFNQIYFNSYIRLVFVVRQLSDTPVLLRLSHIKVGQRTRLTHPIYVDVVPLRQGDKYTYSQSTSELGHYLGRTIMQKGMEYSINQERTDDIYYFNNIEPFRKHVNGLKTVDNNGPVGTFFMATQPIDDPLQVAYCYPGSFSAPSPYNNSGLYKYSFNGNCE